MRDGVDLSRSTLADWVDQCSALLRPLVEFIRRYVISAAKIHADDTPVPVLEPSNGKTRTARFWTYVRDDRPAGSKDASAVWFAYSPTRSGKYPQTHLKGFKGILQADAFAGYNAVYDGGDLREAGCMAHYLELSFMRRNGCAAASGLGQRRVALGIMRFVPCTEPNYAEWLSRQPHDALDCDGRSPRSASSIQHSRLLHRDSRKVIRWSPGQKRLDMRRSYVN